MKQLKTLQGQQAAALWASAFVLAGFVIMQAGRLPENAAYAATASNRGDYSMVTTDSGEGGDTSPDELLYIVDSREQVLLLYEIEDARTSGLILRDGGSLVNLFNSARR